MRAIFHDGAPFGYDRLTHICAAPSTRNNTAFLLAHGHVVRVLLGHAQHFHPAIGAWNRAQSVSYPAQFAAAANATPGLFDSFPPQEGVTLSPATVSHET